MYPPPVGIESHGQVMIADTLRPATLIATVKREEARFQLKQHGRFIVDSIHGSITGCNHSRQLPTSRDQKLSQDQAKHSHLNRRRLIHHVVICCPPPTHLPEHRHVRNHALSASLPPVAVEAVALRYGDVVVSASPSRRAAHSSVSRTNVFIAVPAAAFEVIEEGGGGGPFINTILVLQAAAASAAASTTSRYTGQQ